MSRSYPFTARIYSTVVNVPQSGSTVVNMPENLKNANHAAVVTPQFVGSVYVSAESGPSVEISRDASGPAGNQPVNLVVVERSE